jgi:hypothetical protein
MVQSKLNRIKRRAPHWVSGVLVILMIATAGYFIAVGMKLRSPVLVGHPDKPVKHRATTLADQSLFGHDNHVPQPQLANIGLTVVGLVADPVDPQSRAAIAVLRSSQGEAKRYHVGSSLPDGYRITQIKSDRVIMTNGQGLPYYLKLYRAKLSLP